jgi:hypothetical protein
MNRETSNTKYGYLAVGFVSLFVGIIMFILVVQSREVPPGEASRDLVVLFANVFANQNLVKNELGRFSAALEPLGVDEKKCKQYQCLLRVDAQAAGYQFELQKGDQRWFINEKSPVPQKKMEAK